MNVDALSKILICPQCRQHLENNHGGLCCVHCSKDVKIDGRLLDLRELTPKLPLHFVKYNTELLELAGEKMPDVPVNWRVERVLRMTQQMFKGDGVCLEIGGADGPMTPRLETLFQTTLTLDTGRQFLKRIEAKTSRTVCLHGDAHFLPLADASVDAVICSEVLEHVVAPTQMLLEIRRVLKKDGKVIISVPDEATNNRLLSLIRLMVSPWRIRTSFSSDSHINFYNGATLRELLFRMGFEVIQIKSLFAPIATRRSLRRLASSLIGRLTPSYVLCCARVMSDPNKYWDSLEQQISTNAQGS